MLFASKPPAYSEPGHCLLLPGKRSDEDGGVQIQTELQGIRGPIVGWLSYTGLRQVAAKHPKLGLVPVDERDDAIARAEAAESALAAAEQRVAELEDDAERIIGLRKAGFTVQKAGGRPRTKTNG